MQVLEISVPDDKKRQVIDFLAELGVKVKVKRNPKVPNVDTIGAMNELQQGGGVRFENVAQLFHSIQARGKAFDFLNDEEDLYTETDIKPIS